MGTSFEKNLVRAMKIANIRLPAANAPSNKASGSSSEDVSQFFSRKSLSLSPFPGEEIAGEETGENQENRTRGEGQNEGEVYR